VIGQLISAHDALGVLLQHSYHGITQGVRLQGTIETTQSVRLSLRSPRWLAWAKPCNVRRACATAGPLTHLRACWRDQPRHSRRTGINNLLFLCDTIQ